MTTPSDLRMRARDMERAARELEDIERTIQFLNDHPDQNPVIDVEFPGFKSDGAKAAEYLATYFSSLWSHEAALDHFRKQRDAIKEQFR